MNQGLFIFLGGGGDDDILRVPVQSFFIGEGLLGKLIYKEVTSDTTGKGAGVQAYSDYYYSIFSFFLSFI